VKDLKIFANAHGTRRISVAVVGLLFVRTTAAEFVLVGLLLTVVCFAVPGSYKLAADPRPFRIQFESATPAGEPFRDFLRARAVTTDEHTEAASRVEVELLRAIDAADDWMPTAALLEAFPGRRADKLAALKRMAGSGRITERPAASGGKGREWRGGLVS
jgi:hypothetical protein